MRKSIFLMTMFLSISSYAQDLKCEDFKDGTFIYEISEPFKMKFKVIRSGNEQKEILIEVPERLKDSGLLNYTVYGKVEWISNCSYRLIYDESKIELTKDQKEINSVGGVFTEFIKSEENCLYTKSVVKYTENEQTINGIVCK